MKRHVMFLFLVYIVSILSVGSLSVSTAVGQDVKRAALPQTIKVSGHEKVGSRCSVIGTVKINPDGNVEVKCQIENHHRVSGYTGQLAIGFYNADGNLIHHQSWNRGLNARGGGRSPKSAGIGSNFKLDKQQLRSFKTVQILVRRDSKNPAFKKFVEGFKVHKDDLKIHKDDLKEVGKKIEQGVKKIPTVVEQSLKDINVFDSDSSIRRRLAELDPWEAAKLEAYVAYKRRYLSRVAGRKPFVFKAGDVHYERLVASRDRNDQPLFTANELKSLRFYFDANTFGKGAKYSVTFGNDILIVDSYSDEPNLTKLLAHEVVHSRQIAREGEETFGKRYVSKAFKELPGGIVKGTRDADSISELLSSIGETIHDNISYEQEANQIENLWVEWWNLKVREQNPAGTAQVIVAKPPIPQAAAGRSQLGIVGLSVANGVEVKEVLGGVATDLGLEVGDIIISIDKSATRSVAEIDERLAQSARNQGRFEILVRNVRYGREAGAQEYVTDYGQLPNSSNQTPWNQPNGNQGGNQGGLLFDARLGLDVQPVSEGVKVVSVDNGSVAQQIGLDAGDIVIQINGTQVYQPEDVKLVLEQSANQNNGQFQILIRKANGQSQIWNAQLKRK